MFPRGLKDIPCNGACQHIKTVGERTAGVINNCLHVPQHPHVKALLLTYDVHNQIGCALEYYSIDKRQLLHSVS